MFFFLLKQGCKGKEKVFDKNNQIHYLKNTYAPIIHFLQQLSSINGELSSVSVFRILTFCVCLDSSLHCRLQYPGGAFQSKQMSPTEY